MTAIHYLTLTDTWRRIKRGELSSLEVTEHLLRRIDRMQGELRPYVMVMREQALERAAALDAESASGGVLGLLHGVPVAVKDLLFTEGLATASGTLVMKNFIPEEDATAVRALKDAGAVLIGKTQLTEGAFSTHHPQVDVPQNPWNHERWPGVSSSGSGVAVAAGMAYGALGSDTGGSIRFPSASCGLVGIKPTYGRVSRSGAFALAESLDHIGPMARSVEDAARILQVIAGWDSADATTLDDEVPNYMSRSGQGINGMTVGVDWSYVSEGVADAVVQVVRDALAVLENLGAKVVEICMPEGISRLVTGWGVTCARECAAAHRGYFPERRDEYGPVLAQLLDSGLAVDEASYQELEVSRSIFREDLERQFLEVDVLIAPTLVAPTPTWETINGIVRQDDKVADFINFTAPFDYSGHPTITMPFGLDEDGMPRSFQVIGRLVGEEDLMRVGAAFEAEVGSLPYEKLDG
ncbi:MAG: amidase [Pseudomonadales bacterium]|jgi:amidase|nr:amidase [Pseudomonadales bacterium]MDP6470130.1 amidase [Pseudomonadales bacterium]MDP6827036.1 amidase [Pseudomonadales bacterium]MDP6972607.1 amidase [Pseudomonadales bacterium]|tara:strand:- start:1642 stop:3042 length:1401 start_codon:yes stop_codon:yes gene_type:complete